MKENVEEIKKLDNQITAQKQGKQFIKQSLNENKEEVNGYKEAIEDLKFNVKEAQKLIDIIAESDEELITSISNEDRQVEEKEKTLKVKDLKYETYRQEIKKPNTKFNEKDYKCSNLLTFLISSTFFVIVIMI